MRNGKPAHPQTGEPQENQDRCAEKVRLPNQMQGDAGEGEVIFMSVMDGHRGSNCAEFVKENLERNIAGALGQIPSGGGAKSADQMIRKALRDGFRTTDRNWLHQKAIKTPGGDLSGTCACTGLFYGPDPADGGLHL